MKYIFMAFFYFTNFKNRMHHKSVVIILFAVSIISCQQKNTNTAAQIADSSAVKPIVVTEKVYEDSDDPAIWIDHNNKARSIIIGTDKHKENGGLYVFTLDGKIDRKRTVTGLKR